MTSLAEIFAKLGWRQFHVAETEKYAHVTYFFNGGVEQAFAGEERKLVPSPKVATYDLQPEMSAAGVTDALTEAMASGMYDFIVANFANPDMVGHTGVWDATIRALELIDGCLARIVAALPADGLLAITADHGNADDKKDSEGNATTAHSLNPVPDRARRQGCRATLDARRSAGRRRADAPRARRRSAGRRHDGPIAARWLIGCPCYPPRRASFVLLPRS